MNTKKYQVILYDEVKGQYATLEEAVAAWTAINAENANVDIAKAYITKLVTWKTIITDTTEEQGIFV